MINLGFLTKSNKNSIQIEEIYIPGLHNIFGEILGTITNIRNKTPIKIKVNINPSNNSIYDGEVFF